MAATQTHHTRGDDMEFAFDESTFARRFMQRSATSGADHTRWVMNRSVSNK